MFGSLGAPELVIILVVFGIPFVVLWKVAASRNMSRAYAIWAILGYLGLVIGLLIMLAMRPKPIPSEIARAAKSEESTKPPIF